MSCNNVNVEPTVISSPIDAFGRLRVSNPYTLFDSANIMSKNNIFDESLTGSATVTYSANISQINLNVTEASGDKVIRQSKRVMSYQPGKSLLTMNTFHMHTQTENLRQAIGMFDANNGIFFEDTGTTYQFVRRTYATGSPVDVDVPQASWNGDKLDGTGASGITLDPTKSNILFIDVEWLGLGAVRCGFIIDGKFITAHTFYNANNLSTVYMQTANLPIRYEIEVLSTLAAGTYTLAQICSTALSEGGYQPGGVKQMIGTSALAGVTLTTAGTYYNLATIRLKAGRPYAVVVLAGADVLNISNADYEYAIFKNATPGTAFSYTSYSDNVEYDIAVKSITGGTRIAGGYLGAATAPITIGDGFNFDYQLGQTISGTSDTMTLAIKCVSPSSKGAGILKWFDLT